MIRPKFSLAAFLLVITWLAIFAVFASRRFAPPLYAGRTTDIQNTTFFTRNPKWATNISGEKIARSPTWSSADPNPPVSARQALAAADRFRRERLVDANSWQWSLKSLELLPADAANGKWCWGIGYESLPAGGGAPTELTLFVLMDGEVVEPFDETKFGSAANGTAKPIPADVKIDGPDPFE